MNNLQHANDIDAEALIAERVGVTVVSFLRYDVIACDHFKPELSAFADKASNRLVVCWLNAEECPTLIEELKIESVPMTLVFNNGDEIARFEGPYSREALAERILVLV